MVRRVLATLLVCVLSAGAWAGSIGINVVGADPKTQTLAPIDLTGVVAQKNWNNLALTKADDPNGHANGGMLRKVVMDDGKPVQNLTVQIDAAPGGAVWPATGVSWGFEGSDQILRAGEAHPNARVILKGIPYKKYDVYCYFAAGDNGGVGSVAIAVAGQATKGKVDDTKQYFYNLKWTEGKDAKAESKTKDEADKAEGSNYVVFTGNTANAITLTCDGKVAGGWTGLAAVQIVEVK